MRRLGDADARRRGDPRRRGQPAVHRAARRGDRRDGVGQRCRRTSARSWPRASTRCRARSARCCSTRPSSARCSGTARCRGDHAERADLDALLEELERRDLIRREDQLDHRGPAAVRVHARPDPRRRLRPAAARRARAPPRAGRRVLRELVRRVGRGDRRARAPLARRGRPSRARSSSSCAPRSRRSAAGRRTTRCCSTARRSSSCRRTTRSGGASSGGGWRSRAQASFHLGDVRRAGSPQA